MHYQIILCRWIYSRVLWPRGWNLTFHVLVLIMIIMRASSSELARTVIKEESMAMESKRWIAWWRGSADSLPVSPWTLSGTCCFCFLVCFFFLYSQVAYLGEDLTVECKWLLCKWRAWRVCADWTEDRVVGSISWTSSLYIRVWNWTGHTFCIGGGGIWVRGCLFGCFGGMGGRRRVGGFLGV